MSKLSTNTTSLQSILETIKNLPEASEGIELPELTDPANASEVFAGKEIIDQVGSIQVGTFTIEPELIQQEELLLELEAVLADKAAVRDDEIVEWSRNEDAIVTGEITEYMNDRVATIGSNAFNSYQALTTASFPACTSIGENAFEHCSKLTTASFPACTYIGNYAFQYCRSLTTASFPACKTIGSGAFGYCSNLTTVSFPACTNIIGGAFGHCRSLTSVSFPACTAIENFAFQYCQNLTTVSFPACTSIIGGVFYSCTNLTTVSFPVCTRIGYGAFDGCCLLATASFPVCTMIFEYAFRKCYTLSSLTLGAPTVCTLSNSNAFSSTPYAGYSAYFRGTPYIYVPASLIDAYKSATNWVYFSSYFSTIESLGG